MCTPVAPALWGQRQEDHRHLVIESLERDHFPRKKGRERQSRTFNIMQGHPTSCKRVHTHTHAHTHCLRMDTSTPLPRNQFTKAIIHSQLRELVYSSRTEQVFVIKMPYALYVFSSVSTLRICQRHKPSQLGYESQTAITMPSLFPFLSIFNNVQISYYK